MKAEEKRLAQEAEQQRRRETPETWEHYKAKQEEANRCAREADIEGTTSETWPHRHDHCQVISLCHFFLKYYNSL
jgi:hypothetical protein